MSAGDVEALVLAYGDQRLRGDERGVLADRELGRWTVLPVDRISAEEQVARVPVELGPFIGVQHVLDGQTCSPNSSPIMSKSAWVGAHRSTQITEPRP